MATAPRGNALRSIMDEGQVRRRGRFQLIAEVYSELSKVTWPSREDAARLALLVLGVAVVVGAFLFVWDVAFDQLIKRVFL